MRFHDAKLLSIELKEPDVFIGVAADGGEMYELILENVDRMRCFDLREGNVVLDVTITSRAKPSTTSLQRLFDLKSEVIPKYLEERIARVEAGELTLIHIAPSYGCELIALCAGVKITPQALSTRSINRSSHQKSAA